MNRRTFIRQSCGACLAGFAGTSVLSSCQGSRLLTGNLSENGISIPVNDFLKAENGKGYHSYRIIRNDALQYPICVYRFSDTLYSALWMQCTHQGTELQVSGDALQCPAHGSEFNKHGKVSGGPASRDLRSFPVTIQGNELFIDLRKP